MLFIVFFVDTTILTACQLHRQKAVGQSSSGHVLGSYIPRCTAGGYFEPLQCDSSSGECWCVDRLEGLELIGSRQRVPSMPDCTRFSGKTYLFMLTWVQHIQAGACTRNLYRSTGIILLSFCHAFLCRLFSKVLNNEHWSGKLNGVSNSYGLSHTESKHVTHAARTFRRRHRSSSCRPSVVSKQVELTHRSWLSIECCQESH